jgi:uncharacterized protein YjbI with pentapeptide repeats
LTLTAAAALLVGLPWLVWQGPYLLDARYIDEKTIGDGSGSAALVTGLRTALVACAAALGAGIALLYTARTYRLTRRGQLTERFTKALERLGSGQTYVRIGGILALEQIVQDAPDQVSTDAARVLNHFLRDQAPKITPPTSDGERRPVVDPDLPDEPAADVQAALTALTRAESRTHVDPRETLDLHGMHMVGVHLVQADLTYADLTGANLTRSDMSEAIFTRAQLGGATLTAARLMGADLTRANLREATLTDAELFKANLTRTKLGEAVLPGADLQRAKLTRASLGKAILTRVRLIGADLIDADLAGANLREAILTDADLREAKLTEANLSGANLTGADLRGTDLTFTDLREAILTGADLRGADLTGADLHKAILTDADLGHADLDSTVLSEAILTGADLGTSKGLYLYQVQDARVDDRTLLPPNLENPSSQ